MKKTLFSLLIVIVIVNSVYSQKNICKSYHNNVLIFKIKPEFKASFMNDKSFSDLLDDLETETLEKEFPNAIIPEKEYNKYGKKMIDISTIYRIEYINNIDAVNLAIRFEKFNFIEYAEPLYRVELLYVPNDPMNTTSQYWLNSIKAFDAWDIHQGDTNIIIGISDTGIDLSHDDLIYNIKNNYYDLPDGIDNDMDGFVDNFRGWDFGENNNNTQVDGNNHGVWVSGIAGASTDNGVGVSGAGFKCMLMPIKIINSDGNLENTYQSITYAAQHSCDVLNCSWGGTFYQQMAQDVINYVTINFDMLVISAAGNTNSEVNYYPASYENVLSVAATQEQDEKWSPENSISTQGSSYSSHVDVCAPGTNFQSTNLGSGYTLMWGGTSFAAPIVSGCAGILRAAFPSYSANQIAELLKISADLIDTIPFNIPFTGKLGSGRVNLYNALTMTQTPSIVFENHTVQELSDIVNIDGDFVNYLSDATNLTISISTNSEYASLENAILYTGDLASLNTFNSIGDIIINLSETTPYDYKLELILSYEADDYSASSIFEVHVNPGYKDIATEKLCLSITGNGRLGFSDTGSTIGNGFILNDYFPLFYDCGIISGISSTAIYSSVRQSTDFTTTEYPIEILHSDLAENHIRVEFNDSSDMAPLGVHIIQDTYTWTGSEYADFIIVDFRLINMSFVDIDNYYFGLFNDWDLVDAANNTSRYISESQFMYCQNEGSQTMYSGVQLLSNQTINNYALAQIEDGDGIVDMTDGFADIEKYYMISNSNNGYSETSTDMVQYTGAGPFDLPVGDTITIGFSLIAAESMYNINQALTNSMYAYYQYIHPSLINNTYTDKLNIYPNPASDHITIEQNLSVINLVNIYNNIGELVLSVNKFDGNSIDVSSLKAGIYSVEITSLSKKYQQKLLIVE